MFATTLRCFPLLLLILSSALTEAFRLLPERLHHMRHHSPRDFHNYPQLMPRAANDTGASGLVLTGTGTGFGTGYTSYTTSMQNYTFSASYKPTGTAPASSPATSTTTATTDIVISGTPTTTVQPVYQVCDTASSSCSTVFTTRTTTVCSAVLTGFFTRVTVTDCDQSVTFSTKSSFNLISTTGVAARDAQVTPYVQSVVSYFVAPWQSIAANTPTGITVVVCTFDAAGNEVCNNVQEVWVVLTQVVPVTSTSTVTVSQYFSSVSHQPTVDSISH